MKVLGIGEAVVDKIAIAQSLGEPVTLQHDAGGPVLAALIMLSKLGADCTMVASLGADQEGRIIRKTLQQERVTLVEHTRAATKQHTVIINPDTGERRKFRGVIEHAPLQGLDAAFIRSFDMVVIDRHERKAFYEVIRHMHSKAELIIDSSTEVSDFTLDMMQHATCPIIPIEALAELGSGLGLDEALAAGYSVCRKPFVVTLGPLGSLLYDGQRIEHVPPLVVSSVDTLGAGDIYRGAFAYGRLQGWALRRCATYANTAAALQCAKHGNALAIPDKKTIEASLTTTLRRSVSLTQITTAFAALSKPTDPEDQKQPAANGAYSSQLASAQ
jgi:sugar/nucleoside kinase (ribokinase family)